MVKRISIFSVWSKPKHLLVSPEELEDCIIECQAGQFAYLVTDENDPEPTFEDWCKSRGHN